jgi:hypothetical protein
MHQSITVRTRLPEKVRGRKKERDRIIERERERER